MAKSKSNGKLVLVVAIVAIVLACVIAFLVCTDCLTNWNKYCQWGHDYDEYGFCKRCGEEKDANAQAEYFQIEADASTNKPIKLSQIARKYYSTMGIPASVESAYTLTATLEPGNSDNQRVVWTVEFVNPSSEWATGKNPANYVKAQPTVDGSTQAVVTCLQAFSEPINVIATSEDNEAATANCLCDYVKRIVGMDLEISSNTVAFGAVYTVDATPQYGEGTITGDYSENSYTLQLVSQIRDHLDGLTYKDPKMSSVTASYTASSVVKINSSTVERTFSFAGSEPYDVFGSLAFESLGASSIAVSGLRTLVNNTFKQRINAISGAHMTFTFDFTYTYEGNSYVETTATAGLRFDAETLAIHVVSLSLDNDHIVFMLPSDNASIA